MAPLRIEVSGESTIHRPAERAVVSVTVRSEGPSQEEVSANVTNTSANLRSMLEDMAPKIASGQVSEDAPIAKWTNSSLSTGSYISYHDEDKGKNKSRVYDALTTFKIIFRDFSKLGTFASTLSLMKDVSIDKIDWELTDATKESLGSQNRIQAVRNAIKKGEDYASAIGAPSLPVTVIRDEDGSRGTFNMDYSTMQMRGTAQGMENVLNFEPENVALRCFVGLTMESEK